MCRIILMRRRMEPDHSLQTNHKQRRKSGGSSGVVRLYASDITARLEASLVGVIKINCGLHCSCSSGSQYHYFNDHERLQNDKIYERSCIMRRSDTEAGHPQWR